MSKHPRPAGENPKCASPCASFNPPRDTLITPNLPEAEMLLDRRIADAAAMPEAAQALQALGCGAALLKGGHLEGPTSPTCWPAPATPCAPGPTGGSPPPAPTAPAAPCRAPSPPASAKASRWSRPSTAPAATCAGRSRPRRGSAMGMGRSGMGIQLGCSSEEGTIRLKIGGGIMFKRAVHPGSILKDELEEFGITLTEFARQIAVPANRISRIIAGKRSVSGDTALRLGHWFGTDPQFWLNLQAQFDLVAADRRAATPSATCPPRTAAQPLTSRRVRPEAGPSNHLCPNAADNPHFL